MALEAEELFHRTMETMGKGDTLMIAGGTLARVGETADINLAMQRILPVLLHVTGDFDKYPMRPNPFVGPEEPIAVTLSRNDKRFGHDYGEGPEIGYAKAGGIILGRTVDLWQVGFADFFFVGKSSESRS